VEDIIETAQSEKRTVTFRGEPYALVGEVPAVGAPAPDFTLYSWWNATKIEITRASLLANGMPLLLSVVQSLDTPISRLQAKNFDLLMQDFADLVVGVQVSSDLPFTINRIFVQEELGILMGCSDYFDRNFGRSYGVLLEEAAILTRAVFVIDKDGIIRHVEVVPEITAEPDYHGAMTALAKLIDTAAADTGDAA
jgi:thiol peroxidase